MAFNGSGTYNLPGGALANGDTVNATEHNTFRDDVATALTTCVTRDGQSPATANLPMGGFKHTGVAAASALTDYGRADQVQNSAFHVVASVTGVDTITGSVSPTPAAYATGQTFRFVSAGANTGPATLNLNALGAKAITKYGTTALAAGDIPSGAVCEVYYDGTRFQLVNVVANKANTVESLASPPAIGGTTPAAGTFTTLAATGLADLSAAGAGQIKFPATQNASSNANTLDDYEEGTWTPALTFATPGDLNVVYSVQTGTYTKIGRKVFVTFNVSTSTFTHTTASGALRITGLPFTSLNDGTYNFGNLIWQGITKAGYTDISVQSNPNLTYLTLGSSASASTTSTVTAADIPTATNKIFWGTVSYNAT